MRGPAVLAWMRLTRVFHRGDRVLLEHLRAHDLSLAQFDVLAHVGRREGLAQQELADRLLVTKGNICQLLDRMERSGVLTRRQEGRTNRIFLTARGRELYAAVVPVHEASIERLLLALSPEEQRELQRLLRKLDHALS